MTSLTTKKSHDDEVDLNTGGEYRIVFSDNIWSSCQTNTAACVAPISKGVYKRGFLFLAMFVTSLLWILTLLNLLGTLEQQLPGSHPKTGLRMPSNISELKTLRHTVQQLNLHFPSHIFLLFTSVYLFIRAFSIPGSLALNLLAGSLYPLMPAITLVTIAGVVGDFANYLVSKYLLSNLLHSWFSKQLTAFSAKLASHKGSLLMYLIFLRGLAVIPGWFLNMASPVVGIKAGVFIISTGVGSFPLQLVSVNAGRTLHHLQSYQDIFTPGNVLGLAVCALLPLVLLLARRLIDRQQAQLVLQ